LRRLRKRTSVSQQVQYVRAIRLVQLPKTSLAPLLGQLGEDGSKSVVTLFGKLRESILVQLDESITQFTQASHGVPIRRETAKARILSPEGD
jgi:hypothetical protein